MKNLPELTNAEYELMDAVWRTPEPMNTGDIIDNLRNEKDWKVTTVLTLMGKLINKGYVRAVKNGRAYRYFIKVPQELYQKSEGKIFLDKIYNNSLKSFVAALYDDDALSDDDVKELIDWFENKQNNS